MKTAAALLLYEEGKFKLDHPVSQYLPELKGLRVVARTSAFQFRGKADDVRRIGEQLNVGAVLECSVRRDGDRLRVTAQLVSTEDGYHLWSGAYDGESGDLLTIQQNIVSETARALRMPIPTGQSKPLASRRTENPEAHDLYLQGRYYWSKRNVSSMQRSVQLFEGAIQKDPSYARAYAGLADAYAVFDTKTKDLEEPQGLGGEPCATPRQPLFACKWEKE